MLSAPHHELTRWQRSLRFLVELSRQGVRQLRQDRASQMAAALAFRTLFGMIPVLAIAMVLFKSFGGLNNFQELVHGLLVDMGLNEVRIVERLGPLPPDERLVVQDLGNDLPPPTETDPKSDGARPAAGAQGDTGPNPDDPANAGAIEGAMAGAEEGDVVLIDDQGEAVRPLPGPTLVEWIDGIIAQVQRLDLTSLGLIGIAALIWAAIGLLTTIERSFNTVCRAPEHRPLSRRLPLYWTTITLGPVLIYMSFYANNRFGEFYRSLGQGQITDMLVAIVGTVSSFFVAWLFFFTLYALMPNTRMKMSALATGSLFGAVLWQLGNGLLTSYLAFAFSGDRGVSMVYASLGLIPVFMVWVYIMWLVILFGLEVASAVQTLGRRRRHGGTWPERMRTPALVDPLVVLPLMYELASRFRSGRTMTAEQAAKATNINRRSVEVLLEALHTRRLVHQVEDPQQKSAGAGNEAYVLAMPPELIQTEDLVRMAHELITGPEAELASLPTDARLDPESVPMHNQAAAWRVVHHLRLLQVERVVGGSLADLSGSAMAAGNGKNGNGHSGGADELDRRLGAAPSTGTAAVVAAASGREVESGAGALRHRRAVEREPGGRVEAGPVVRRRWLAADDAAEVDPENPDDSPR